MDAGINNVIYMELHSGPKMANSICGKTIVAGMIDRGSTVYYDRSTTTDQMVHNDRSDIVTLDKTIKEAQLIDVTIPNSFDLYSNIIEKLQKNTYLK